MLQSLRWKLIGAFSLTIIITILLSNILSIWMATTRFDVFITDESRYLAEEVAPILEESYAITGSWNNLSKLLAVYSESSPPKFFEDPWISDVDWFQISMDTLGFNEQEFFIQLEQEESLAAIAEHQGIDPEKIVFAIIEAEQTLLDKLTLTQEFSPEQIVEISTQTADAAKSFVYSSNSQGDYALIDEMFWDHGEILPINGELQWTEESINWLLSSLLIGDERLLVADKEGTVVYDSENKKNGEKLSEATLGEGHSLLHPYHNFLIGTVIVAAQPGYYNFQQTTFLKSMNWALIISGLIAGILALFISLLVTNRITAPVTALIAATHRIANGRWNERLPIDSNDELGQMSTAFNNMAQALENQQKLRSRLVDDVRHELNTPLSVIQLELEALKDGLQSPSDASEHVEREISLLQNLVNDLSFLSEFGELELDRQPTDFTQLIIDAITRWQPHADAKHVNLKFELIKEPPEILADARRITQVLGNLISNALTHTPQEGLIEIRTELSDNSTLITTVHDTGSGIQPEDLSHIFERFYRTDYARNRNTGGRGLGLAIAKQIIELHGGQIWAKSFPNEGSTFGFELPL